MMIAMTFLTFHLYYFIFHWVDWWRNYISLVIIPYQIMFLCFFLMPLFLHAYLKICLSLSSPICPIISQDRSQVSYLSHLAKGWVTSSGSAEDSATHRPSCIWSSHSPGHWKSHQSFHNLSSALWKNLFFFISSMKTCCYKAFLLTTEIPLSLFQVASWFFLSKVFPLSQLY